MVYINIQDTAPAVFLPLNGWPFGMGTAALSVKNTVDGRILELPITNITARGFLAFMNISVPEGFTAGEWEYRFTAAAGEDLIASGLMVAYDGPRTAPVQYESEKNVIQYGG